MSLNVKNEEAHSLARQLAELTGESLTTAVTESVRQRLERVRQGSGQALANRLLEIGAECAAQLREPYRTADHAELLYDEQGLPR
jgi:antitoxin VapB